MSKKLPDQDLSDPKGTAYAAPSPRGEPVDRDGAYRLLYGSATMMEDFLLGFTSEEFTNRLDLSTLRRAETQHVSENLARSANDLIWEVSTKDGECVFVTLMLEFQHRSDWTMPARMALYVSHVILELMRSDRRVKQVRRIPQVLPIVLYTGSESWNAETDLEGMRSVSAEWARPYDLQLKYHVVDVHRCEGLPRGLRNVTDSVFRIERGGTLGRAFREAKKWRGWLAGRPDEEAAGQALVRWALTILRGKLKQAEAVPVLRTLGQLTELLEEEMTWVQEESARADRLQAQLDRSRAEIERVRAEAERTRIEGEILGVARFRFGNEFASSLRGTLRSLQSEEALQTLASWTVGCDSGGALMARIEEAVEAQRKAGS